LKDYKEPWAFDIVARNRGNGTGLNAGGSRSCKDGYASRDLSHKVLEFNSMH
jgi:hypothetical protein